MIKKDTPAIRRNRHTGSDSRQAILPAALRVNANLFQTDLCRYLGYRDVISISHPWLLDSGNPCRNDGILYVLRID
ncbi:MAG: hypothetical protein PHD43_14660 [Methylococcales bacterium]|nr:hypothetical protein [Methylococcales bacterium]